VRELQEVQETIARLLRWVERGDEPADVAEAELAESASGHAIALAERAAADGVVPLHVDVALIRPGWGNKRDKHYYPREVVARDAGVFAGVKMYESDHRDEEKSTRTWVSTVKEIVGFADDGAPIGRVTVHDRGFAERLMALAADDLLEKMECSILAAGTARKGSVDGQKGHIVEAITSAESVDWVTRAGAGGRALSLAESDNGGRSMEEQLPIEDTEQVEVEEAAEPVTLQEQEGEPEQVEQAEAAEPVLEAHQPDPEPEPVPAALEAERVAEILAGSGLPQAAQERLRAPAYGSEDGLREAMAAEVQYVKTLREAGRPFAQGAPAAPQARELTAEEREYQRWQDFNRVMRESGIAEVPLPAQLRQFAEHRGGSK
jgi:hypothetical protein